MYRRNISNILYPIAGVLGLIIVYQAVLKPTYIQSPPLAPGDQHEVLDFRKIPKIHLALEAHRDILFIHFRLLRKS